MEKIKNFLKKILPPPVRTFLREIEGLRKLTERLNRDLAQNQKRQLEQTEQLLTAQRQQAEQMARLLTIQEQQTRQAAALAERNGRMEERLTALEQALPRLEQRLAALDKLDAIRAETGEIKEALAQQKSDLQQAEQQRKALGERVEKFAREAKRKDPFAVEPKLPTDKAPRRETADAADAQPPEGFARVIPVVFATNDNYAPYTGVAIESILRNTGEGNYYRIYVLHDGLSRYHRESLDRIAAPNARVRCIDVSARIEDLREHMFSLFHFTKEAYFRFLIPELFPFFEKVVYLDGDLVVRHDIAEIIPEDMGNNLIAGVHNLSVGRYIEQRKKLGLDLEEYINTGVLVIDIAKWIKEDIAGLCFHMLKITPREDLLCPDQDIVNKVCVGRILHLGPEWNFRWGTVYDSDEIADICREEVERIGENFHILHFTSGKKPWTILKTSLSNYFWKYARTSCFYEELLNNGLCK